MAGDIVWLTVEDAVAIHEDQLRRFGGASGIKSIALLESAMAAPINLHAYEDHASLIRLGAHLAHAIARNHAFVDGNKRTATAALLMFLYVNGCWITLPDTAASQPLAELIEKLAAGEVTAASLADWLEPYVVVI